MQFAKQVSGLIYLLPIYYMHNYNYPVRCLMAYMMYFYFVNILKVTTTQEPKTTTALTTTDPSTTTPGYTFLLRM